MNNGGADSVPVFLEAAFREPHSGLPALLGAPLDQTCTYRSGTGEAPRAIRISSDSIESYSPTADRDLRDYPFADVGDVPMDWSSVDKALEAVGSFVRTVTDAGALPLTIGGEHSVALPIVRLLHEQYPDLVVIQADAHADLRDAYEGTAINHATVMQRIVDLVGFAGIVQIGIRSATAEEYQLMRRHRTLLSWTPGSEKLLRKRIGNRPVYLTFDIDVLDPSCLPGTGNPELGGFHFNDVVRLTRVLADCTVVGADVVELNPSCDTTEASSIATAKIVRELLLMLGRAERRRA